VQNHNFSSGRTQSVGVNFVKTPTEVKISTPVSRDIAKTTSVVKATPVIKD
jgi:hypothetical protein